MNGLFLQPNLMAENKICEPELFIFQLKKQIAHLSIVV